MKTITTILACAALAIGAAASAKPGGVPARNNSGIGNSDVCALNANNWADPTCQRFPYKGFSGNIPLTREQIILLCFPTSQDDDICRKID